MFLGANFNIRDIRNDIINDVLPIFTMKIISFSLSLKQCEITQFCRRKKSEKIAQNAAVAGGSIIWAMPKRKGVFFFPNFAPFPTEFAVNSISQANFPVSDENTYFQSPSKHLKGQLGPRVGHITFFNQRRSVVSHCHIMFLNYQPS